MYMQFGFLALDEIIQVSDHPVAPSFGSTVLIGTLSASSRFAITCQVVPIGRVAVRERRLLLRVVRPVLADVLALLLEQVDRGLELLVVELVDVVDPEVGLGRLQVHRRVGDVDRVVVGRDLALVGRLPGRRPRPSESGACLILSERHISRFAPRPCGMPYGCAVDRVPRLVLQRREDVRVVRDQVGVDRRDVAARDQAQRRVTGRRDAVVLAGAHQRDHLVGGVADLDVDLAAGLLLEVATPSRPSGRSSRPRRSRPRRSG